MKEAISRWKTACVSAGLSALFLIVYGGCNWIAASRINLGSLFFEWEKNIPFVPLLIPGVIDPVHRLDLFATRRGLRECAKGSSTTWALATATTSDACRVSAFGRARCSGELLLWGRLLVVPVQIVSSETCRSRAQPDS